MQRACGITAMLSIRECMHLTSIDPEENHEREEGDIEALIRKIEGQVQEEQGDRAASLQGGKEMAARGYRDPEDAVCPDGLDGFE